MYLLVFLGLLSVAQSDIPQNTQGQWIIPEKNSVYEDPDGFLEEESVWSENPPEYAGLAMQDQKLLTTPEPDGVEEDANEGKDSAMWKIALLVPIALVCAVGGLSVAYYMCVWRGGRIYYNLHKVSA